MTVDARYGARFNEQLMRRRIRWLMLLIAIGLWWLTGSLLAAVALVVIPFLVGVAAGPLVGRR